MHLELSCFCRDSPGEKALLKSGVSNKMQHKDNGTAIYSVFYQMMHYSRDTMSWHWSFGLTTDLRTSRKYSGNTSRSALQNKVNKWHILLALLPNADFLLFKVICPWASSACLHLVSWEQVLRKHLPADLSMHTPLYKLISADLFWLRLTAKGCWSSCAT